MKNRLIAGLILAAMLTTFLPGMTLRAAAEDEIPIDAEHFPDDHFRAMVYDCDADGNGGLSQAEIAAVTELDCYNKDIASLQGVEYLTALITLNCEMNRLTELDIRQNHNLRALVCDGNQIASLDLSGTPALERTVLEGIFPLPILNRNTFYFYYEDEETSSYIIYDKTTSLKLSDGTVFAANPFADVSEERYYFFPVVWATHTNPKVTEGTSADRFSPNSSCTRAQVVTFLWNLAGKPEPETTENPFTDVKNSAYYYKPVLWALEQGITSGKTETTFAPKDPCTRAEVVTFLWKYSFHYAPWMQPVLFENPQEALYSQLPFTDVKSGSYYFNAVVWAYTTHVTSGTDKNHFSPQGHLHPGTGRVFPL